MTRTRSNALWTFTITSLALFMVALDNLVVTTALPVIKTDLGASLQDLQWIVNAYTLTFAVLLITGAALGDRFGRKRVFLIGMGIFIGGSALAALSTSTDSLILARAIQGVGGAIVTPLTLTILSAAMPPERRAVALGAWGGIAGLAIAIGPLVGGAIAEGLDWHWIFWLNVPIGLVVLPMAAFRLTETYGPEGRLDIPGLGLISAGLLALVWGVINGNDLGWGSTQIVAALVAGTALLVGFVVWEARQAHPMLPMSFFRSRAFSAANAVSLLMYFGMFGSVFLLAQFFQVAQGYSPFQAGLRTLPWTGMPIIVAPIAGILADRIGGRPILATGMALQAVALGWLAAVVTPTVAYEAMVVPFILAGVGMGLFFAPIANVVLSAVRPEQEGKASGATNTIREVGGVFGVAVLAAIFSANGDYTTPAAYVAGSPAGHRGRRGRRRVRGDRRAVHPGPRRCTGAGDPGAADGPIARGRRWASPPDTRIRPTGRVRGPTGRVPCPHALPRQPRHGRRRHRPPRSRTGRSTRPRLGGAGPAAWASVLLVHGLASTPAATSTSATRWRRPASTSMPTTSAGTADRAAGAATSIAGRSTTTTSPSGSRPSGAAAGGRPVVLYGHSMGGLVVLGYLLTDRPKPDLAVLSSPALDSTLAGWKKTLAPTLSRVAPTLALPNGIDRLDAVARPGRRPRRSAADPLGDRSSTDALRCRGARRTGTGPARATARARRSRPWSCTAWMTGSCRPRRRRSSTRSRTWSGGPTRASATSSTTSRRDPRSSTRSSPGSGPRRRPCYDSRLTEYRLRGARAR